MAEINDIYSIECKDSFGRKTTLEKYRGYVLLIVNVASSCGLAEKNYLHLTDVLEANYAKGLRILLFPCNDFFGQEKGVISEIRSKIFGYSKKFDLFDKVKILSLPGFGSRQHDLFKFLKDNHQAPWTSKIIKWNFTKFLVNHDGNVVHKYGPADYLDVDDPIIASTLEKKFKADSEKTLIENEENKESL